MDKSENRSNEKRDKKDKRKANKPKKGKTVKESKKSRNLVGPANFEKVRIIGYGSVGLVYLVKQKDTNNYFAMKILKQKEMIAKNKV